MADPIRAAALAGASESTGRADERIVRRSLTDEVVERLRDLIIAGELTPGERLPERALSERFGISRTPLREAMKVVASEGLLKLLPNRGALVPPLTVRELEEAFEVMESLEATAGELAARRIDEATLAEIRRLHERMVLHYRAGELQAYFKANQQIHWAIVRAARNEVLAEVYRRLSGRVLRARYAANLSQDRWTQAIEEHEAILAALEARDGPRLSQQMRDHLRNKRAVARRSGVLSDRSEEAGARTKSVPNSGV